MRYLLDETDLFDARLHIIWDIFTGGTKVGLHVIAPPLYFFTAIFAWAITVTGRVFDLAGLVEILFDLHQVIGK